MNETSFVLSVSPVLCKYNMDMIMTEPKINSILGHTFQPVGIFIRSFEMLGVFYYQILNLDGYEDLKNADDLCYLLLRNI